MRNFNSKFYLKKLKKRKGSNLNNQDTSTTPCYSGFYFKIKKSLDFDIINESWEDFHQQEKMKKTFFNGDKYKGHTLNVKMHGRGGRYYSNGNIYEGDFVNDKINGRGTYYWTSGDKYEGTG